VTETIRPDTVFVPYHWPVPVAANVLTIDALDPRSKIPEYKVCAARVEGGEALDAVPMPPMPDGHVNYLDPLQSIGSPMPPTMPQGRGPSEQ
jgi:assimilatory nitrate reductase catalytic subunit